MTWGLIEGGRTSILSARVLRRKLVILPGVVFLAVCAGLWFYWLGRVRWMDRDEGMYGLAAELLTQGLHPWRDFLYPQAPLYPYILSSANSDLLGLRSVSAVFGAVMVGVLAWFWCHRRSVTAAVWGSL
ncbi:MAG: hypothetical protein ACE5HE_01840, partial [Phycisphaerae bacterium]